MKLRSLGILIILQSIIITAAFVFLLFDLQKETGKREFASQKTFTQIVLPLRQIDANTKNLRFHLYAAFMHNPDQSVAPLHTHPITAHTSSVRAEMEKNRQLWAIIQTAIQDMNLGADPKFAGLRNMYDGYFSKGIIPGVTAAENGDWTGIVRTVTATLPEYIAFEKSLQVTIEQLQKAEESEYMAQEARLRKWTWMMVGFVCVIVIGAAWFVGKTVTAYTQRLTYAVTMTEQISSGDLSLDLAYGGDNEASSVLKAMHAMQNSMRELVGRIRRGADTIQAAASDVSSGNSDLQGRTVQQAGALEQAASSIQELTNTLKQNATDAELATRLVGNASSIASKGGEAVLAVVNTMQNIDASSSKIVDIISVIDGIAFQTNILALNAAVEAARAGEQGRGFAVVASEVRNLAHRSSAAAKEIKTLIDSSAVQIRDGSRLVEDAGSTMSEIVSSVQCVSEIMLKMEAASKKQSQDIEKVNQVIGGLDGVTQQNAALVEQASAAAYSLSEEARKLTEAVMVFKLVQAPTREARATNLLTHTR